MKTFAAAVCALFTLQNITADPVFLQPLCNITVAAGGQPVIMTCIARADNLYWYINDTWYTQGTKDPLSEKGFSFSPPLYYNDTVVSGNITVRLSPQYNNTIVKCLADDTNASVHSVATILSAGVPLEPNPEFLMLTKSTVQVEWEAPFSWSAFPITNYTVIVINQTSQEQLANDTLSPDILSYNLTEETSSKYCGTLEFYVNAISEVGTSSSGYIRGSFPTPPGKFTGPVNKSVLFTEQGTSYLKITFTFPFLCPYNDATYTITVIDDKGELNARDGPYHMSWKEQGSTPSVKIRLNISTAAQFKANITVTTVGGQSSTAFTFRFNRNFGYPGVILITASITGGGFLSMVIIITVALCLRRWLYQRKKGRQTSGTNDSRGEAIYEEIPGPCSIEPLQKTRDEGCTTVTDSHEKEMQEDAYTVMNPVGSLSAHRKAELSTKNAYQ